MENKSHISRYQTEYRDTYTQRKGERERETENYGISLIESKLHYSIKLETFAAPKVIYGMTDAWHMKRNGKC